MMNHKERVLSAFDRHGYDRIPVRYEGTPEITQSLIDYLDVANLAALLEYLGDDFRTVKAVWNGPELRTFPDGSREGMWGERYNDIPYDGGTYPEAVYLPFKDMTDVANLKNMRFPSANYFDYSTVKAQCEEYSAYTTVFGNAGYLDFINGTARCRGVEQVLLDIGYENPVYLALIEQRYEFFYEITERALQAAEGLIDIVHVGEDWGTQKGLLISPRSFDQIFAPKYEAFFAMAHRYGAKTMMHSCGSVRRLIPHFIEIGLDILDVVQVSAADMDISELYQEFSAELCFCGSICVQTTLPNGTVEDVRREVEWRQKLFCDGGLFLAPTHQIQVGTPLENILAIYRQAGSLVEDEQRLFPHSKRR